MRTGVYEEFISGNIEGVSPHYTLPSRELSITLRNRDQLKAPVIAHFEENAFVSRESVRNCCSIPGGYMYFSYGNRIHCTNLTAWTVKEVENTSYPIVELKSSRPGTGALICQSAEGVVSCFRVETGGSLARSFEVVAHKGSRVAVHPGGKHFSICDPDKLAIHDSGCSDPVFSFPNKDLGPTAFAPDDEHVLFHGGISAISIYDVREGGIVSSIKPQPATVSYTAYSSDLKYTLLEANPGRSTEIAAFSSSHAVVQIFDTRMARSPVCEYALPECPTWSHMEYDKEGKRLLVSRTMGCSAYVMSRRGDKSWSCMREISVVTPIYTQIHKFNTDTGVRAAQEVDATRAERHKRAVIRSKFADAVAEVSLGCCFGDSGKIFSVSSFGNIFSVTPTDTAPAGDPPERLRRFFSFTARSENIEFSSDEVIEKLKRMEASALQTNCRIKLNPPEQIWLQFFLGLSKGLSHCKTHPKARKSKPGSFWWNQCVSTCSPIKHIPGPGRKVSPGDCFKFSIISIIIAFAHSHDYPLPRRALLRYLETIAYGRAVDWCQVVLDERYVTVKYLEGVEKLQAPVDVSADNVGHTDTLHLAKEEGSFSSSDDEGEGEVMRGRQNLVKPMLLVKQLRYADPGERSHVINKSVLDRLRLKYPAGDTDSVFKNSDRVVRFEDEAVVSPVNRTASDVAPPTPPSAKSRRAGF